jgi:hypothetical protein
MPAETRGSVRQRKTVPVHPSTEEPTPRVVELNSSDDEDAINGPLQQDPKPKPTAKARARSDDEYSPWVDVLRVITFLLLASAALSYLISSGDSFTWGLKHPPKYLTRHYWEEQFVSASLLFLPPTLAGHSLMVEAFEQACMYSRWDYV